MNTSIVQLPEIYANPYFILLLLFLNNHWTYPIRFVHWFDNTCSKHLVQLQEDLFLVFGIKAIWPLLNKLCIRFQSYFHHSQITYDAFQVQKFCGKQILIFTEKISDLFHHSIIPIVPIFANFDSTSMPMFTFLVSSGPVIYEFLIYDPSNSWRPSASGMLMFLGSSSSSLVVIV